MFQPPSDLQHEPRSLLKIRPSPARPMNLKDDALAFVGLEFPLVSRLLIPRRVGPRLCSVVASGGGEFYRGDVLQGPWLNLLHYRLRLLAAGAEGSGSDSRERLTRWTSASNRCDWRPLRHARRYSLAV